MKPADEMRRLFADLPEAIDNTLVVAQRCAVAAPARKPILPSLAGDRDGEAAMLRADAERGLEARLQRIAALRGWGTNASTALGTNGQGMNGSILRSSGAKSRGKPQTPTGPNPTAHALRSNSTSSSRWDSPAIS